MSGRASDGGLSRFQRATFKRGSTTYFNSSLFFPAAVRRRVFALYAFVRRADDFVDAVPQDGAGFRAFRSYAESLPALGGTAERSGGMSGGAEAPVSKDKPGPSDLAPEDRAAIDAYAALASECSFDPSWTGAFLDAMEADLNRGEYDTLEETLSYVYGSAEVIGLFMARILGLPAEAEPSARMLGRSMQYINFIRDLAEDVTLGRRYLPLEGEDPRIVDAAWARAHPDRFGAWLRGHIGRYRSWQDEATTGYRFIPARSRAAVATAADMYWWTAARIEEDPLRVFDGKVKPSRTRILLRLAANVLSGAP